MADYLIEAIRWFIGVGSAAVVAVYLVRANRRKIESDEALNLSQAASNLVDRFERDIARLETKVAALEDELEIQRQRRLGDRDRLETQLAVHKARIDALETFIKLNTDVDPAHI